MGRRRWPWRRITPLRPLTVRMRLALLTAATAVVAGMLVLGGTYALLLPSRIQAPDLAARVVLSGRGAGRLLPGKQLAPAQPNGACRAFVQLLSRTRKSTVPVQGFGSRSRNALRQCLASLPPNSGGGVLIARVQRFQRAEDLRRFLTQGGIALALLALLSLAAGWWVAGRVLGPLQVMTRRVRDLSAQTPLGRIGLQGPRDELQDLADTFDGLLGRLDGALAADRRFVANASHELRTPLAIQETLLDVALADPNANEASLREMAERLRQVNGRSKRLIDGLLALARSQQGLGRWERVDLAAAVADALQMSVPEACAVDIHEDLRPAVVRGDPALLERLAGNLVENAIRYNVPGGWVRVRTESDGGRVWLHVANSGPVIDPVDVAALFEPFRRGRRDRTESRRGTGLGLSIVRAIAGAHNGTATAKARTDGGLEVLVELPLAEG